jgi:DNA-binding MarR family transcriptional regulator
MARSFYLSFLQSIHDQDHLKSLVLLDSLEEVLLNHIALMCHDGRELLVKDLTTIKYLGSKATLHKRIHILVLKGYIQLIIDSQDRRKRIVVLTEKSNQYFNQLSLLLEKAINTN